jgi:hypothetical protein
MKKLLLISVWLTSAWTIWGAEANPLTDKYREKEVSIDLFGSASLSQDVLNNWSRQKIEDDGRLGAGVGVNYFHTRNFGLGLEAVSESTGHSLFDSASINLLGRLPIGNSSFAPYGFVGTGYQFEGRSATFAQGGAGLEYRFNAKFGAFADVRYIITDGTPNNSLGRLGIRICF